MKANRKLIEREEAVSAVIGVILMVAITVAIAATVYVWVTGFGGGGTPAPSMNIDQNAACSNGWVNFTVISASANARWEDLKIMVNGTEFGYDGKNFTDSATGSKSGAVKAGEIITIYSSQYVAPGSTLQIIHVPSNSIVVTKTLY